MRLASACLALTLATPALAGPKEELAAFRTANTAARAAYDKKDWPAAEHAFREAMAHAPQRPGTHYNLAIAELKLGNKREALAHLAEVARMGIALDAAKDTDFAELAHDPAFAKITARLAGSGKPMCRCTVAFTGTHEPFIAEGIALAGARMLVASIHTRRIVAIENGRQSDFITVPGGYSPFGMNADASRNTLWLAAARIAQGGSAAHGSALLAYDLKTGALKANYPLSDDKVLLGDVARAKDGSIYVSDSNGGLYRLALHATALEKISDGFASPQGMLVSDDGRTLLVADYAMGLIHFDIKTAKLTAVAVPPDVTTLGIDGLTRRGATILATQNGIAPPRILRLHLSEDWRSLIGLDVLSTGAPASDPSLITSDGHNAYAVAVSQWSSFDDKPDPTRPTEPWMIVRLQ